MIFRRQVNQQPAAAFRINVRVLQIIALVLVALAVPVALVILGVRQISSRPNQEPAMETPGLRASLELAADKNFAPPEALMEDRVVFVLSQASVGDAKSVRQKTEQEICEAGGVIIPGDPGKSDEESLLAKIPAAKAASLEAQLLESFSRLTSVKNSSAGEDLLIEIRFPKP